MTYYDDLTSDKKRVNAFYKAIRKKVHGITYDLGTGSGILAAYAAGYAEKVNAIEKNSLIMDKTSHNLSQYDNVKLIQANATEYEFTGNIDVVICEMLDTALIDEEQIPVINHVVKYANDDTDFIPMAVYSTIELISANTMGICYYEDGYPEYTSLSDEVRYCRINLNRYNNPEFETTIRIRASKDGLLNAIKITTYTILSEDVTLDPTPMLNPPLVIPIEELNVNNMDEITIKLKYTMGGGLNTIQATGRRNK